MTWYQKNYSCKWLQAVLQKHLRCSLLLYHSSLPHQSGSMEMNIWLPETVRIWGSSPILLIMFYLLHRKQKSGKQSADEIPCQVSSYFFTGKCKLSSKQAAKLKLYSKSACEESHPVREHWETSSSQHFILQILLKYSLHSNSSKQKLYSCIWKQSLIF